jgi:ATP-dependent DNA helicase RecQ
MNPSLVQKPLDALKQYWGYDAFRGIQEEVIGQVLSNKDLIALMPTGGGKSLCYQIPGLCFSGITIVITPLIALMKDQADDLNKRNIPAACIHAGMKKNEVERLLEEAGQRQIKFLFVSPERLQAPHFLQRMERMPVSLIAVDEAHCISQWGYDFRPAYLRIADIREWLPDVPVLALTATATSDVIEDIATRLKLRQAQIFRMGFARKNLHYMVLNEEDKWKRMLGVFQKIHGSGLVYLRNRRKTEDVARFLNESGISASFYHAGLEQEERAKRQQDWLSGRIRVMACTNAFGMGINKPDVRSVVHMTLPDCIENYFQEAGRGGRDGQTSYAVLLYEANDALELRRQLEESFPELPVIRQVYQALAHRFQIAAGLVTDKSYELDVAAFCETFKLNPLTVFHSIRLLEKEGYIAFTEESMLPARVHILVSYKDLYEVQVFGQGLDNFIKLLLRTYSGLFDHHVRISEYELAGKLRLPLEKVEGMLKHLHARGIIEYLPRTSHPLITFLEQRVDAKNLRISPEHLRNRKEHYRNKMEQMIAFASGSHVCRSVWLLNYFGDKDSQNCGSCDVCIRRNKLKHPEDRIRQSVMQLIAHRNTRIHELPALLPDELPDVLIEQTNRMVDNQLLKLDAQGFLKTVL